MRKLLTATGLLQYSNASYWYGAKYVPLGIEITDDSWECGYPLTNSFSWSIGQEVGVVCKFYYDDTYYEQNTIWGRIENTKYQNRSTTGIWVDSYGFGCFLDVSFTSSKSLTLFTYSLPYVKVVLDYMYVYTAPVFQQKITSKKPITVARSMLPLLNNCDNYDYSLEMNKCGPLYFKVSNNVLNMSTDNSKWTACNNADGLSIPTIYRNGLYQAFHYNTQIYYYSTDGLNWVKSNLPEYTKHPYTPDTACISWSAGKWICFTESDSNGSCLYYSTNGKTWNKSTGWDSSLGMVIHTILKIRGTWVVDGYANRGGCLMYSSDGVTWSENSALKSSWNSLAGGDHVYDLQYIKGYFYADDWDSNYFRVQSYTDSSWTNLGTSIEDHGTRIRFGAGLIVCKNWNYSTNTQKIRLSYDGNTWTEATNLPAEADQDLYYTNGVWDAGNNEITVDFNTYFPQTNAWGEFGLWYNVNEGWSKTNTGAYRNFKMNIRGYYVSEDKLLY